MAADIFGSEKHRDSSFQHILNSLEQTAVGLLGLKQAFSHETHSESNDSARNALPELTFLAPQAVPENRFTIKSASSSAERFEILDLALQKQQVEKVQTLLENAEDLEESSRDKNSDLIIRRDGSIELNPLRTAQLEGTINPRVLISFEYDKDSNTLSPEQKAALRDVISYLHMHNPDASYTQNWQSIFNSEMPPPMILSTDSLQIPSSRYSDHVGLRSSDGSGFSGAGGERSSIFARYRKELQSKGSANSKLSDHLNQKQFIDQVVHAVSGNEGNFVSLNRNDCGYGISIGIRQWNQKVGELPTLLKAWQSKNPREFNEIFGEKYSDKLCSESWVRNYNMSADPDLMTRMDKALHNKAMQATQVELARQFVKSSIKLAQEFGFKSELGIALVCDLVNQTGTGGARSALRRAGLRSGKDISNEQLACKQLSQASHRQSGHSRFVALQRKFSSSEEANLRSA